MKREDIEQNAKDLILRLANGYSSQWEGHWSLSVYDSAWLAMIQSPNGTWLFPESFDYVLNEQQSESGWNGYASEVDGILNTMAAILAIEKHASNQSTSDEKRHDLRQRSKSAIDHLHETLRDWDVDSCLHVGFEVLVPALLDMLKDIGVHFQFPGEASLMALKAQKMQKFIPDILYGTHQTTALHCLEAFIGKVDFRKLGHHKVKGSMLGSPSATAAYLIGLPGWDEEAEHYLRICIQYGGGNGLGGVPSAFPCDIFELTWVISTLLYSGMPRSVIETAEVSAALEGVAYQLRSGRGVVGFCNRIIVMLFQVLNRLLFSPGASCNVETQPYPETVAYKVLACNALRSLPFPQNILAQVDTVISRGQEYLASSKSNWKKDQYLWIEKVTYSSRTLSEAYCLAGLFVSAVQPTWTQSTVELFQFQRKKTTKLVKFFHAAQGQRHQFSKIEASVLEGCAFIPQLRSYRSEIFPLRDGFNDKYLAFIPASWTIVNNIRGLHLSTSMLWDMMKFSLLDFLVDEYMESSVALLNSAERAKIQFWIRSTLLPDDSATVLTTKRPLYPDFDGHSSNIRINENRLELVQTHSCQICS